MRFHFIYLEILQTSKFNISGFVCLFLFLFFLFHYVWILIAINELRTCEGWGRPTQWGKWSTQLGTGLQWESNTYLLLYPTYEILILVTFTPSTQCLFMNPNLPLNTINIWEFMKNNLTPEKALCFNSVFHFLLVKHPPFCIPLIPAFSFHLSKHI